MSGGPLAQAGAEQQPGQDPLFGRLVWLTLFRLALVTVLLGGAVIIGWREGLEGRDIRSPLYLIIIATYTGALAVALMLRRTGPLRAAAVAHLAFGGTLAAGLTGLTGGPESVFLFMFLLAIVDGAILLHRWGAVLGLAVSLAGYGAAVFWSGDSRSVPGTTLWVHAAAFVATAMLAGWLTEQLRATGEKLAVSESDLADVTALHEEIVQSVTSGILTVDDAGRITFLNRSGEQLTGLVAAAVRGQPLTRLFPGFVAEAPRGETEWSGPDGRLRVLGFTGFSLGGARGRGQAVIFQDLTGLRAMEEAVRRGERLADLGMMAAGLAHELRNPLASMSGSVELLQATPGLGADESRLLGIVIREAARLEQLVTRFLDYSRPAEPRRAEVDLPQLLGELLEVFSHDPVAARMRIERHFEPATLRCDPGQIRQVVWNLLVNGAQALQGQPGGGTIGLSCSRLDAGGVRVVVEDDGPGIAAADLPRLFTPFFTTKAGGTGLGLATVHQIVEAHGGEILAGARDPRGARFTILLPDPAPSAGQPAR